MDVLVTGGTGFVGREIVRQLRVSGHRIHLLVRNPQSPGSHEVALQHGAKLRPGNVLDPDSLQAAFAGVDAVIHLVGIISELGDQNFENVHVRGTRNVVFASQDAKVAHFLHMSALGASRGARSRYHQTKWEAEELVRRSGLGWSIFRPSIIYGSGDGFVSILARLIRYSPLVPILGGGQTKFQPVLVKSVGTAFVKALGETRAIGETYDLCGPETFTLDELVDEILSIQRTFRFKVHIPSGAAVFLAAFLELLFANVLRQAPPLNRDQLLMLKEDSVGNGQPANLLFGLKPVSFRQGTASYLARNK